MSKEKNIDERKTFVFELEEHAEFNPIAVTKYLTSNEFCKLTSELFRSVFADFEGCNFEYMQNGEPTIALFFNHGQYDEDVTVACSRFNEKMAGNSVLDSTRRRDQQRIFGDRYHLTEDGEDAVKTLLVSREYNNGKPNWGRIVADVTERSGYSPYMNVQVPQYTKVSFISPARLCNLIFGDKVNGSPVEYSVVVAGAINPASNMMGMAPASNYLLNITRADANEVKAVYEKLGFTTMGSSIIR